MMGYGRYKGYRSDKDLIEKYHIIPYGSNKGYGTIKSLEMSYFFIIYAGSYPSHLSLHRPKGWE